MLPHPRLVFLLQGQMMGSPHKVVHTPAFQRNLIQFKKREREKRREEKVKIYGHKTDIGNIRHRQ